MPCPYVVNIASITAVFEARDGRTRATRLSQRAPLKIARTFELANGALGACIMDASPGMLAGDCYQLDFAVAADARVEVTTQGFTRVHPSRDNRANCRRICAWANTRGWNGFPNH